MKRIALYCRVSTQEQKKHGLSVDNQIQALRDFCKENNYIEAGLYNDAGISARKRYTKRPALLQLISDCKAGKIDLICFTKLDRWFRSVGDYYEVQRQLDDCKVPWRAIWEDYETETSAGIFKVNIMLSVAQSEADRTSERIKATMKYKKDRGDYIGSAPIGYVVRGRDLIKDEAHKEGMQAFFDAYLSTLSITQAVRIASDHGLKLDRNHMIKLIKNPTYYGEASNGYKCEPYITKDQHDLIVETISKGARQTTNPNRVFIFSGLCECGYCHHRMSAKAIMRTHADGQKVEYNKYLCQYRNNMKYNCPHLQITESYLEAYLLDNIERLIDVKIAEAHMINKKLSKNGLAKKQQLEDKLKRLAYVYAEGDIDIDAYRTKKEAIKSELDKIVIEPVEVPERLPNEWKEIYNDLDKEHKQILWKRLIKNIVVTNENKQAPEVEFL